MHCYKYDAQPISMARDYEGYIIRSVAAIMLPELRLNNPVEISLMTPSDKPDAKLSYEAPVGGLCDPTGRHIYLLHGLPALFLVRAVAHELRHAHQAQKLVGMSKTARERDAQISELEFMNKLGWPMQSNLIRCLANAINVVRDSTQSRAEQLRKKLTWEENLLADLLTQRAPSQLQMTNLRASICEMKSEIGKIAAEVARL